MARGADQRRRNVGVTEDAIERIRELIASGEWRAGTRLPREADLAAQLGISRNSLREAVRALARRHLPGQPRSRDATACSRTRHRCLPPTRSGACSRRVLVPQCAAAGYVRSVPACPCPPPDKTLATALFCRSRSRRRPPRPGGVRAPTRATTCRSLGPRGGEPDPRGPTPGKEQPPASDVGPPIADYKVRKDS